jgi:lipoate synthase
MKPSILLECLVSDFQGDAAAVRALASSPLDVYAHNVETVERLQPFVRDRRASYRQSLATLAEAKRAPRSRVGADGTVEALPPLYTKTSLMLGLGEARGEVLQAMRDIRAAGVDVLTLGQYLRPTVNHLAVVECVAPLSIRTFCFVCVFFLFLFLSLLSRDEWVSFSGPFDYGGFTFYVFAGMSRPKSLTTIGRLPWPWASRT